MAQPTYGTHRVKNPGLEDGFGLQTARTGLRYRNPVIERTAISRVSKSFRGDLQPGKVAMPRGPRSEKRPADVIGAGHYLPWASPKFKLRINPSAKRGPRRSGADARFKVFVLYGHHPVVPAAGERASLAS